MELRTLHKWVVRPQMLTVPGVAEINTWGGFERQFHVVADMDRLLFAAGQRAGRVHRRSGDPAVDALCLQHDAAVRHRRESDEPGGDRLRAGGRQLGYHGRERRAAPGRGPRRRLQARGRPRGGRRGAQADALRRADYHDRLRAGAGARGGRGEALRADGPDGDLRFGRLDDHLADPDAGSGQLRPQERGLARRRLAGPLAQEALPAGPRRRTPQREGRAGQRRPPAGGCRGDRLEGASAGRSSRPTSPTATSGGSSSGRERRSTSRSTCRPATTSSSAVSSRTCSGPASG